ncbi:cell wall-active antibiotics response protein LiaF [Alicyclobacillus dauci]|uniref:Cell wall-active antibiotics response protein LiaF n=1 Tax=Alicyclobacillus dauci TaxID=1475485 RepID=A0ABY6Z4K3_9BACL|nr:cell wall-active antibiotics response protein LiaF [Alicyclobacillus dauci]WAH37785.1 cell wall-active antibiotics response protein LiaF [Alicyclobacillus dauci]
MRRSSLFGIVVVLVGLFYLLLRMQIIPVHTPWTSGSVLWPLLLVVAGLYGLVESRSKRVPWTAIFMILLGVGMSLKGTHLFPFLNVIGFWGLFFGLAIVLFGLSLIFPGRTWFGPIVVNVSNKGGSRSFDSNMSEDLAVSTELDRRNRSDRIQTDWRLIGDLSIGRSPWVLRDMRLWNGIGDVRVNLATAHVEDGTYRLDVRGWIGDIRVLVPEDLPILVEADVSVGNVTIFGDAQTGTGRSVQLEDEMYASAARRCHLILGLRIGDVEVVRV